LLKTCNQQLDFHRKDRKNTPCFDKPAKDVAVINQKQVREALYSSISLRRGTRRASLVLQMNENEVVVYLKARKESSG